MRTLTVLSVSLLVFGAGFVSGCASEPEPVSQREIAKVDLHSHFYYDRSFLEPVLRDWRMDVVILNGGPAETDPNRPRWEAIREMHVRYPERVTPATSFDARAIDEAGFAQEVITQLEADIAAGARAVKMWKEIGMVIKDSTGAYVQIDDPRFDPIWEFLARRDVPVVAHIGEPRAAWQPLDEDSPHYGYYSSHPEYHAYRHPEIPDWTEIMAARDRWLEANPELTVIGAHMGSMAHDVDLVAERLDAYPNFFVGTGGRFPDLRNQSDTKIRSFLVSYSDRILYGTDLGTDQPADSVDADGWPDREAIDTRYREHWEYLARDLSLPASVLRSIYGQNARRVLGIDGDRAASGVSSD